MATLAEIGALSRQGVIYCLCRAPQRRDQKINEYELVFDEPSSAVRGGTQVSSGRLRFLGAGQLLTQSQHDRR